MKPKISFVTLGVKDVKTSLAFYRDGLKFPTHNFKEGEDFALFKLDGSWLALYPREKLAEDALVPERGMGFRGFTLSHNEPSKEAVDRAFAEAIRAGAVAVKAPHDAFWGGYSGYFADPDGNLWEIAFNPFTDLT